MLTTNDDPIPNFRRKFAKKEWKYRLNYILIGFFVLLFSTPLVNNYIRLAFILVAISYFILFRPKQTKNELKWLIGFISCIIPSIFIDIYSAFYLGYGQGSGLFIIVAILFSIIIAKRINWKIILPLYAQTIFILGVLSTILYALFLLNGNIISYAFKYEYDGYPGYSFGLLNVVIADGEVVMRNAGFASEPGVFQIYLNIAYAIFIFYRKLTVTRFVGIAAAITTANSTAGLIIFAVLTLILSGFRMRVLMIALFAVIWPIVMNVAQLHYTTKIEGDAAFLGRFEPFLNAVQLFGDYIWGFGSVRYDAFYADMKIGSYDTFSQTLVRFGALGFVFLVVSLINSFRTFIGFGIVIGCSAISNNIAAMPAVLFFAFLSRGDICGGLRPNSGYRDQTFIGIRR
jgi:hypothetical protein